METAHSPSQLVLHKLRIKHLRLIDILARAGTLHRAAGEMNLTQPAATKILQDLEDILGAQLFHRHPRAMELTEIGGYVVAYARRTLSDTERFLDGLQNLKSGGYGALSIGAIMATAPGILPTAIARLKAQRPLMTIHLVAATSDELLAALERNELELVIGRLVDIRHQAIFSLEPLGNEELWLFVAATHPLASAATVSLADLSGRPWVLQPPTSPMRKLIERRFAELGLQFLDNLVETTSIFATLQLVHQAGMISVLPSTILAEGVTRGDFVRLPVAIETPLQAYGVVTRRNEEPAPNAAEFIRTLRELAAAPIAG